MIDTNENAITKTLPFFSPKRNNYKSNANILVNIVFYNDSIE